MQFLPWYAACAFVSMLVISRIVTDRFVRSRYDDIVSKGLQPRFCPCWVSSLYLTGVFGLIGCAAWSLVIAWWAPVPVVLLYFVQQAVFPSALEQAKRDSNLYRTASNAVNEAVTEMGSAIGLIQAYRQGQASAPEIEKSITRANRALGRVKPLVEAVADPVRKFGMLMFVEDHSKRYLAALEELGNESKQ